MSTLPDFRLETHFSRWEFAARYNMAASDMQTLSLAALLQMAAPAERAEWESLQLGYIETWGTPALRQVIAASYATLQAEDVLCFAGAEEGLYCALLALLGPDDHALVTVPNYQSMETVPASVCQVEAIPLRPENRWQPDLDDVRRRLRPNTRLIAVNFPNNPTGAVADADIFAGLIALCAERGIHFFSDEVYHGLEHDPTRRLPQAADCYERALSLNVLSKAYGLPGLRIGWIASRDRALLARLERMKHYLSICNAAPSELLARIALANRETLVARNRERCAANLQLLDSFFARHAERYDWQRPDGGCTAFVRYRGADGVENHCRELVEQAGILLLPASLYQSELAPVPTDRFRVGFGRDHTAQGLQAWEAFLRR